MDLNTIYLDQLLQNNGKGLESDLMQSLQMVQKGVNMQGTVTSNKNLNELPNNHKSLGMNDIAKAQQLLQNVQTNGDIFGILQKDDNIIAAAIFNETPKAMMATNNAFMDRKNTQSPLNCINYWQNMINNYFIINQKPQTNVTFNTLKESKVTKNNDDNVNEKKKVSPFKCKFCNKRFSRKCNLEQHTKTHSQPNYKRFQCNLCGRRFVQKHRY